MFKSFCILMLTILLSACNSPTIVARSAFSDSVLQVDEPTFVNSDSFRVGVLLPLSGEAATVGNGLKKATMIALEDLNNSNLVLQYYDTQSSPEGARVAAENALNQQVKMIIGPLTSSEVGAISYQTRSRGVPVVAFSSNTEVLQNQIYTLGLLIDEQIERIISYAAGEGRSRFALLIPDNSTGIAVARSAVVSAGKHNAEIVKIAFYPPDTNDFSSIVSRLTDYEKRSSPLKREKERLRKLAKSGDIEARNMLKKLNSQDTAEGVDFDAVIIPDSGSRLKSATAMFAYYDVFAPEVLFLGTSVWENTKLNRESTLNKSLYPVLSRSHSAYFNKRYQSLYGTYPNSLYAFAYDAVALASALSRQPYDRLDSAIVNPDGFAGINGVFRIFANGKNQHSLDIMQVTPSADIVVDLAPRKFLTDGNGNETIDPELINNQHPQIFGKDSEIAYRLIFGFLNEVSNQNGNGIYNF